MTDIPNKTLAALAAAGLIDLDEAHPIIGTAAKMEAESRLHNDEFLRNLADHLDAHGENTLRDVVEARLEADD